MKTWHKIGIGVVGVILAGSAVGAVAQVTPIQKPLLDRVTSATTASDRETIKSDYIVANAQLGTFNQDGLTIQITKVEKINGGLQVFARAWKNGVQLGFGPDGTTDLERFRIFNPPILVPDSAGPIQYTSYKPDGTKILSNYREDAVGALKQVLAQTMNVTGRTDTTIVQGSVGHTTDTFYSNAGGDGSISTAGTCTFASGRNGTCTPLSVDTTSTSQNFYEDTNYSMRNLYYPFDTSSIPSGDVVSSATFSVYGAAVGLNTPARGVGLLKSAQASLTTLATTDYVPASYTEVAARKNIASLSTGTYNDYTITDLTVIAKGSSFTKLMLVNGPIIDNDSVSGSWYFNFYSSDQTGTTQDPKLVVVHTAAPAAGGTPSIINSSIF